MGALGKCLLCLCLNPVLINCVAMNKQDPKSSRDSYYCFRNFISFEIHEHHHITSWRRIGIIHWLILSYRSCFMNHDSYYTGIYLSHLSYYSLNSLRSSWLKPWWWWGHSNGALMRQNGVEKGTLRQNLFFHNVVLRYDFFYFFKVVKKFISLTVFEILVF